MIVKKLLHKCTRISTSGILSMLTKNAPYILNTRTTEHWNNRMKHVCKEYKLGPLSPFLQ